MEIVERHILDFDGENDYKPSNYPPKKNGFYMTIRCGLGGIYSKLNEWCDGHWMVECLDDSRTIAYSRQPLPKEKVHEWIELLLKKSKRDIIKEINKE